MPLATEEDILEVIDELGVSYEAFGFQDNTQYRNYVESRWNRVDNLIRDKIGVSNHDEVAFPEQHEGHVYWTVAEVVRRRRIQMLVGEDGGSGGFTIGKYKQDSNAPSVREHRDLHDLYKGLSDEIFEPFVPVDVFHRIGGAIFLPGNQGRMPWSTRPDKG